MHPNKACFQGKNMKIFTKAMLTKGFSLRTQQEIMEYLGIFEGKNKLEEWIS